MPRRILLLITDLQIGGTPTVVRELAVRLAKENDVYVHVACLGRWGPVADQLKAKNVAVTALNASSVLDVFVVRELIRLIKSERIDTLFSFLVHANAAGAVAVCARDVRFIQSIQTTQPNPWWHWLIQRIVQHGAEKIVVPTPSVAAAARERAGVPEEKIEIIPNAVDAAHFANLNPPASGERGPTSDSRHVGFIGRLDPIKRIPDLLNAIALLDENIQLDIFGQGSEHPRLELAIESLKLSGRAALHGAIESPREALANMDVLVLPSEAEGFGLVLIEAMAAGVPVVGTNVPGIRDVVVDGINGLLAPPRNPRAIADAIERIFSDSALREKIIAGGHASIREKYNWNAVYAQYRKLLLNRI